MAVKLKNPSFEDRNWIDRELGAEYGYLKNQIPNGWDVGWAWKGDRLPEGQPDETATGVAEIRHMRNHLLPPDEQVGQKNALITDGLTSLKISGSRIKYSTWFRQFVKGIKPGSLVTLKADVQVHFHPPDNKPDMKLEHHGAEFGLGLGDSVTETDQWWPYGELGDRRWVTVELDWRMPVGSRELMVTLLMFCKWGLRVDFFIDNVQLMAEADDGEATLPIVQIVYRPKDVQVELVEVE